MDSTPPDRDERYHFNFAELASVLSFCSSESFCGAVKTVETDDKCLPPVADRMGSSLWDARGDWVHFDF